ncbi:hypothetical protein [Nocardia acidivorans]|uniref:hypothetical protein n=1 Tax=Nocardia acidivorans TaxID=404580 RepID=UPI00082D0BA5|nr:hypothetical protein [Nocardia acidivorans]
MTNDLDITALTTLTEQYIALWNEADPAARTKLIAELWSPDGAQVLTDPPQEIREAAAALAFPIPHLTVRGHRELDARVTRAYEMFIAPGEYTFAPRGVAQRLAGGLVGLGWSMVSIADGSEGGTGYDVLALDQDGRIRSDHQYIGPA